MIPGRAVTGALLVVAAVVLTAPAAGSAVPPQLSISAAGDRESVAAGDRIGYTVTLRNLGSDDLAGLHLTQTVPPGLAIEAAEPAAVVEAGAVRWIVDLAASAELTVRTTMTVGDTPPEQLRLASVACAAVAADSPPVVCAAHSAQLPAGAWAAASPAGPVPASTPRPWPFSTTAFVTSLAVLTVLAAGALLFRRRRSRVRPQGADGVSPGRAA